MPRIFMITNRRYLSHHHHPHHPHHHHQQHQQHHHQLNQHHPHASSAIDEGNEKILQHLYQEPEVTKEGSLSGDDGVDSDSSCGIQHETRAALPGDLELGYGWPHCRTHYSVLYELMTQSPTKASHRDAPEHAVEFSKIAESPEYEPEKYEARRCLNDYEPEKCEARRSTSEYEPEKYDRRRSLSEYEAENYERRRSLSDYESEKFEDRRCLTEYETEKYEARRCLSNLLLSSPTSPESSGECSSDCHVCIDCGKRYSTSSNLARHRQTHRSVNDKKARKCPHCDKVYVSMPAFSMHVRTHNQGCECPYCGKRFSRPWLLQGHIRTHTGEKPFACPKCAKAFADKSNLRAHIQTHSSEKPYVCGRCGKAFALKSYLYKHEESSCMRGQRFRH